MGGINLVGIRKASSWRGGGKGRFPCPKSGWALASLFAELFAGRPTLTIVQMGEATPIRRQRRRVGGVLTKPHVARPILERAAAEFLCIAHCCHWLRGAEPIGARRVTIESFGPKRIVITSGKTSSQPVAESTAFFVQSVLRIVL